MVDDEKALRCRGHQIVQGLEEIVNSTRPEHLIALLFQRSNFQIGYRTMQCSDRG